MFVFVLGRRLNSLAQIARGFRRPEAFAGRTGLMGAVSSPSPMYIYMCVCLLSGSGLTHSISPPLLVEDGSNFCNRKTIHSLRRPVWTAFTALSPLHALVKHIGRGACILRMTVACLCSGSARPASTLSWSVPRNVLVVIVETATMKTQSKASRQRGLGENLARQTYPIS